MSLLSICTVVTYVSHSNGTQVVSKTEHNTDEAPVVLIPASANATETAPEASAHTVGPSGTDAREKLKRRTSHPLVGSDDEQMQSDTETGE
jgi:hypothetical protein